jgi:dephospho-CoA kinase
MAATNESDHSADAAYPKPVIGIVGGIGAGKSAVADELQQAGCYVIDSDALAHQALDESGISEQVRAWLGENVIGTDGKVNRKKLGEIVFRNPVEIQRLNSLIHPRVEQLRKQLMESVRTSATVLAVVWDSPLLLESGLHRQCDAIIYVEAPLEIRQKRVAESRGWDAIELARRENFQQALDKKKEIADHIVVNDGDPALLGNQVREVLNTVLARFGRIYEGKR